MKHIIIAAILVVAVTAVGVLALEQLDLVPQLASEEGALVDQMFTLQLYIIVFIFALIVVFVGYSVVVFRRKPGEEAVGPQIKGSTLLEILWTVIPLIVVIAIGALGAQHLSEVTAQNPDELLIQVTGFQFGWRFEYPEQGISSPELVLPRDKKVHFELTSTDVIHSFWVPEFRLKQDAVPGKVTHLRITPSETGTYKVRCAELCGYAHTNMLADVRVVEPEAFEDWAAGRASTETPSEELLAEEKGQQVASDRGCLSCHSVDGSPMVGSSWLGLYGSERPLADGTTVVADETYLRTSILEPGDQIVKGYNNIMPDTYDGVLSDQEIEDLIVYIKSLEE